MANINPLRVVIEGVDRLTAPLRRINRRIESMTSPVRRLRQSLRTLGEAAGVQRLGGALSNAGNAAGNVARQVGRLGVRIGALVSAAGGAAFALVNGMTQAGDAAAKTASRLGVGVEWLQEMRYAAERSGVATSTFDMAIQRAGRRIGEFAATGKGEAGPVLEAMGLQLRNATGELRPMEELLPEIAEKLNQLENPMLRNAAAMKLFDSEGVAMVQLLGEGADGMEALRARARELGLSLGEEATSASEKFQDGMTDLKGVLTGIRNVIGMALLPIIEKLRDQFIEFLVGHRERIAAFARDFAEKLPGYLEQARGAFMSMLSGMRSVMDLLSPLGERFGWFKVALAGIAAVMFGPLLLALAVLAKALIGLGVVLLTTPVGWFLAAVAAIGAAVYLIYKEWDSITQWFSDKFAAVREAFDEGLIQGVLTLLREFNPVLLVTEAIEAIIEYITGVSLFDVGSDLVDSLWDGIKEKFDGLTRWFEDKIESLTDMVPDWMKSAGGTLSEWNQSLGKTVGGFFGGDDAGQAERNTANAATGQTVASTDPGGRNVALPAANAAQAGQASPAVQRVAETVRGVSGGATPSQASVLVRFENAPAGMRVEQQNTTGVALDLELGHSMGGS